MLNDFKTTILKYGLEKTSAEMVQMTGHIPRRPSLLIILCIVGLIVRNSNHKATARLEQTLKRGELSMQIVYMLQYMPHSNHIERSIGKGIRF